MSDYHVKIPYFIEDSLDCVYDTLFEYTEKAAERFRTEFKKKITQIQRHPFSCAVDQVYPSLTEKSVRKAVIYDGRYLLLYMIKDKNVVVLMVERAERDYITSFEANLKLYNETDNDKRDG